MGIRWSLFAASSLAVGCQAPEPVPGTVTHGDPVRDPAEISSIDVLTPPGHRPAPPDGHLQALSGESANLAWLDRDLLRGEVVEHLVDGAWAPLPHDQRAWVDPDQASAYRLRGPYHAIEPVLPRPVPLDLVPPATGQTVLVGGMVALRVDFDTPGLTGMPLAIEVHQLDDGRYLEPWCAESEAPCWSDGPLTFADLPDLDQDLLLNLPAPRGETSLSSVEVELFVPGDEPVTLAHGEIELRELGYRLAWGDLHSHTNLSHDGCEDSDNDCLPDRELPAEDLFTNAARHSLEFAAITDHAEYGTYTRRDTGVELGIWDRTLEVVAAAEAGPVLAILGYEWTGSGSSAGHRTVLLEDPAACEQFRIPAGDHADSKAGGPATEAYSDSTIAPAALDDALALALDAAGEAEGCTPTRWLAYYHHPAYWRPKSVKWTLEINAGLGDSVVEIMSEHGSSECADLDAEGCLWMVNEPYYTEAGSVQTALQLGYKLGFVGGSDSHDCDPGSVENGPGAVWGGDAMRWHHAPGAITGVMALDGTLEREAVFDAIEARRTLASTWPFRDVHVAAVGADGIVYLPGQDVPAEASPLELVVAMGDPDAEDVVVELLDETGAQWIREESPLVRQSFDLAAGEVRYVRVRAWVDEEERRLFASPFFGEEAE